MGAYRGAFFAVGGISGLINVLMLTGSLFMLQVYDRVLPSRSVPTLVGLAVLALVLYAFQAALDALRGRLLARIAAGVDERVGGRVYDVVVNLPLRTRSSGSDGLRPLRDFDQIGNFLSSTGPAAFFDLPWMPLYIAICFAFHPWLGIAALVGGILLLILAFLTDRQAREPNRTAATRGAERSALAEAGRRNAEVLAAMGMGPRFAARWAELNRRHIQARMQVGDVAGGYGALSRAVRMALQSAVLGIGAYLVIFDQASAGIIIASSILTARGLAPVEQVIAHWKGFLAARQSWTRLGELLAIVPAAAPAMALPAPQQSLAVEAVTLGAPGSGRVIVDGVSFALEAGSGLGIIGPSASGKSSLARALVGVWTPLRGKVRLDGAALEQWRPDELGRHVGYLPQDVELFSGTVAENIARFDPVPDPAAIVAASRAAGVHEMILRLPEGYETEIGEGGAVLSGGQRQRIGLARALYGEPFLVVLDEPNASLDAEGEKALTEAIQGVRRRGGIAIVIAHRPSAIAGVDMLLTLAGGRAQAFGPKTEILNRVLQQTSGRPLAVVGNEDR